MIPCLVRKKPVSATPEEKVRQACLSWMVKELGYPLSQIAVEVSLKELPHLKDKPQEFPDRRVDILVYSKGNPVLLIECKAEAVKDKSFRQLLGYCHWVGSPYCALVGAKQVKTYYADSKGFVELEGLPLYYTLEKSI